MKMKTMTAVAAVALAGMGLAGCGDLLKGDKDARAAASKALSEIAAGGDLKLDKQVDPSLSSPDAAPQIAAIKALMPTPQPTAAKDTGWSINADVGKPSIAEADFSYTYPSSTVDLKVMLTKAPGTKLWVVNGLSAQKQGGDPAVTVGAQPKPKDGSSSDSSSSSSTPTTDAKPAEAKPTDAPASADAKQ